MAGCHSGCKASLPLKAMLQGECLGPAPESKVGSRLVDEEPHGTSNLGKRPQDEIGWQLHVGLGEESRACQGQVRHGYGNQIRCPQRQHRRGRDGVGRGLAGFPNCKEEQVSALIQGLPLRRVADLKQWPAFQKRKRMCQREEVIGTPGFPLNSLSHSHRHVGACEFKRRNLSPSLYPDQSRKLWLWQGDYQCLAQNAPCLFWERRHNSPALQQQRRRAMPS